MPGPPALTPEQRAAASAKAVLARAVRARLRRDLAAGDLTLAAAFDLAAGDDERSEAVGAMRVAAVLESLPGVGARRAEHAMVAAQVGPTRRVRGVGPRQREALLRRLAPRR